MGDVNMDGRATVDEGIAGEVVVVEVGKVYAYMML